MEAPVWESHQAIWESYQASLVLLLLVEGPVLLVLFELRKHKHLSRLSLSEIAEGNDDPR